MSSAAPLPARVDLKAGRAFLFILVLGCLGVVLSIGVAWVYWVLADARIGDELSTSGLGVFGLGRGAGGTEPGVLQMLLAMLLVAVLASPAFAIGCLLCLFILVYPVLGFFYGWRRARQKVVEAYALPLAERLSPLIVERLASLPVSQDRIERVQKWIAEDCVVRLAFVLGNSFWAWRAARFAARRLPWAELLSDWEAQTTAGGEADIPALTSALSLRINKALNEIVASPLRAPIAVAVTAHAVLLGLAILRGIWFWMDSAGVAQTLTDVLKPPTL
jgi:hypothetical protein